MKRCSKCKEMKPTSAFSREHRAATGLRCSCRRCDSLAGAQRRSAWTEHDRDKFNAYRKSYDRRHRARTLISRAKSRSKKYGHAFDLDAHHNEIAARISAGRCELSGIPFDLDSGRTFASPSIDRIDPKQGYVYSNIRVICYSLNMALGDWGEEALHGVVVAWLGARQTKAA